MSVFMFLVLKKVAFILGGYLVALLAMLPPPRPAKRPPPWWGLFQAKPPPHVEQWVEPQRRPLRREPPFTDSPTI